MSVKITNKDILWGYIGPIFNFGTNVILMPFVLTFLSDSMLGLWYIFSSIGNLVILFDFGFSPTLARNIAYCYSGADTLKKEGVCLTRENGVNIRLLKEVTAACKCIYLVVSISALAIMSLIGTSYVRKITEGVNEPYLIAWIVYCTAVFFNLYYGYLTAYLKGLGAVSEQHKAIIFSKCFQIVFSLVLLKLGLGLLAVSISYLVCGLSYRITALYYVRHYENIHQKMKQYKEKVSLLRIKELFLIIWHNAWKDGLVSISNYMTSYATTLICSAFLSLAETGIYSLSLQLVQVLAKVSAAFYSTFQPRLQALSLESDKRESGRIMAVAIIVFYTIFGLGMVSLLIIGIPILHIIKPDMEISRGVLAVLGFYMLLNQNQQLFSSYISNTNHLPYIKAYIFWGVASVALSVFILYQFNAGVWGMLSAQMLCLGAYNMWKWPCMALKNMDLSWGEFIGLGFDGLRNQWGRHKN